MPDDVQGGKAFSVDEVLIENVINNKIKKLDVLGLKHKNNCVIYMVCLALGVHKGLRTKSQKGSPGLARVDTFSKEDIAFINAVVLEELRKDGQENKITDDTLVNKIITEYVNTGLNIIDEMIPDPALYDSELVSYELLSIVSEEYERLFPEK